jgi:hypothetical protein
MRTLSREKHLGTIGTVRTAQGVPELIASLSRYPGPVDGEDAVSAPAELRTVNLFEAISGLMKKRANELRVDLLPGLAKGGSRHGLICRE